MALPDLRERLHHLLEGEVEGETSKSARGKTKTVLLHIWAGGPSPLQPDALDLLRTVGARGNESRLALHWGMCLATYPFFSDVVSACGRLLSVQNSVVLSQVTRRMTESWGELSTLTRAVQRVVRSMVDWGALCETKERGVFARTRPIDLSGSRALALWLLEAALVGGGKTGQSSRGLVASPALYPFKLGLRIADVSHAPRLEVIRQGVDDDVVVLSLGDASRLQRP